MTLWVFSTAGDAAFRKRSSLLVTQLRLSHCADVLVNKGLRVAETLCKQKERT